MALDSEKYLEVFNTITDDIKTIADNLLLIQHCYGNNVPDKFGSLSSDIIKTSQYSIKSFNNPMTKFGEEINNHGKFFHINYRKFYLSTKEVIKFLRDETKDEFMERHYNDIKNAFNEITIKTKSAHL